MLWLSILQTAILLTTNVSREAQIYKSVSYWLPAVDVYVHEKLVKKTLLKTAVDIVACSTSEAMKTSWYVPEGKHMLWVVFIAAELFHDEEYEPSRVVIRPNIDVLYTYIVL